MKLVLLITKGLLRDVEMRRKTMFFVVLVALAMLFAGSTFLAPVLHERVFVFILFWGACAWLTILSVLLAVFDILIVRAQARAARKALQRVILETAREDADASK